MRIDEAPSTLRRQHVTVVATMGTEDDGAQPIVGEGECCASIRARAREVFY